MVSAVSLCETARGCESPGGEVAHGGGQSSHGGQEQGLLTHESQLGSVPHPVASGRWIHTCEAQFPVKWG